MDQLNETFVDRYHAIQGSCARLRKIASAMSMLGIGCVDDLFCIIDTIEQSSDDMKAEYSAQIDQRVRDATQSSTTMINAVIAGLEIGARKQVRGVVDSHVPGGLAIRPIEHSIEDHVRRLAAEVRPDEM